jgi:hypothetical protein
MLAWMKGVIQMKMEEIHPREKEQRVIMKLFLHSKTFTQTLILSDASWNSVKISFLYSLLVR